MMKNEILFYVVEKVGLRCKKAINISWVLLMQIRAGVLVTSMKKVIYALTLCIFSLGKTNHCHKTSIFNSEINPYKNAIILYILSSQLSNNSQSVAKLKLDFYIHTNKVIMVVMNRRGYCRNNSRSH